MENNLTVEITLKKKELKAVKKLLVAIMDAGFEGVNPGACELALQQVEEILENMSSNNRNVATISGDIEFEELVELKRVMDLLDASDEDEDEDLGEVHDILDEDDSSQITDENDSFQEILEAWIDSIDQARTFEFKEEPAEEAAPSPVSSKPANKDADGFNYIPGTKFSIRPSSFLSCLK